MTIRKLDESRITYILADGYYSWVHFIDGKPELIARPLCVFEQKFPAFIRTHKGSMVNPAHISRFVLPENYKHTCRVIMADKKEITVSKRRINHVDLRVYNYTRKKSQ